MRNAARRGCRSATMPLDAGCGGPLGGHPLERQRGCADQCRVKAFVDHDHEQASRSASWAGSDTRARARPAYLRDRRTDRHTGSRRKYSQLVTLPKSSSFRHRHSQTLRPQRPSVAATSSLQAERRPAVRYPSCSSRGRGSGRHPAQWPWPWPRPRHPAPGSARRSARSCPGHVGQGLQRDGGLAETDPAGDGIARRLALAAVGKRLLDPLDDGQPRSPRSPRRPARHHRSTPAVLAMAAG